MLKYFLCLGAGRNQLPFLKRLSNKNNFLIVVDRNKSSKGSIYADKFYNYSIYKLKLIRKIIKDLKKKKIKLQAVIYRSSGPTILSAMTIEKKFNIKRINKELANCVYSKSYFASYLKSKKLPSIYFEKYKKFRKIYFNKVKLIKSDAPFFGKKNVFLCKEKLGRDIFFKCKTTSHNKSVIISDFIKGHDISLFYLVDNKKNYFKLISPVQEFNPIIKTKVVGKAICSPPLNLKNKVLKKINNINLKLIKTYKNFFGIISVSVRINSSNQVFPYEINVGLSGDGFADLIFPCIYRNKSLYDIEIDMLLKKMNYSIEFKNNKFAGLLKNKIFFNKKKFKFRLGKKL